LIDREKLPELVPMDAIVGTLLPDVAEELGLSASTPVVTGLNDNQAGGMGSGAFTGTHAAVSVGSTSMILTHVGFKAHGRLQQHRDNAQPRTRHVLRAGGERHGRGALERFLTNIVYGSDHFSAGGDPRPLRGAPACRRRSARRQATG